MNQSPITNHQSPLLVIVGQTASGKSDLAMRLAEKLDGEIICADSRTVYKGMEIGTAKPSSDDQARVPHHLLDVVLPNETFTVVQFKKQADAAIKDIVLRGKIPILVGGSGLYIDSVIYDYQFPAPGSSRDVTNPRHKAAQVSATKKPLRTNTLIIGIELPEAELKQRILERIEGMVEQGFIAEVSQLTAKYGPDIPPLQAPGYQAVNRYLQGELSLAEARAAFAHSDYTLARKQRTWFKRNSHIAWFTDQTAAFDFAKNWLIT